MPNWDRSDFGENTESITDFAFAMRVGYRQGNAELKSGRSRIEDRRLRTGQQGGAARQMDQTLLRSIGHSFSHLAYSAQRVVKAGLVQWLSIVIFAAAHSGE